MKRKTQIAQLDKKRKKLCVKDAVTLDSKAPNVKDSRSAREQAEPYLLTTAKFPVDALSPIWSLGTNRPINESHKRILGGLFKDHGLRRTDVGNRLLIACSKEDVEKMECEIRLANIDADRYLPRGNPPSSEPKWPYFRDWMQVVGKKAELMAGNHRVEALKELLSTSKGGDDERWWLCDIYDKDALPSLLHVRLRANREDVILPDSHGQIWAEMASLASADNTLFIARSKELEKEMIEMLGLIGRSRFPVKRLATLWRNKNWNEMITKLCGFSAGQAIFSISAFEWMASCRIDDFWFSFFRSAIESATRVRNAYGIEIEPRDWIQLAGLPEKSSHADVMELFYPGATGDPYAEQSRPRRKDFIAVLNDKQYRELYLHVLTRSVLRFPDIHLLMKTTKAEGKIMSTIVTHIAYWLNDEPAIPHDRNPNKPLLRMAFVPALQHKHGKSALQKSIELENQVLTYVRAHMDSLVDKTAEHFLDQLPTNTEHDYSRRFNHPTWRNILIIVHAVVGPYFVNKALIRFNHEDPNTIKCKPLKNMLHSICDVIGSNPEISESPVLSKKSAIETLHTILRPIIARWAVEQCDNALTLHSSDLKPAELKQLEEERAKYAVLQDTEMEVASIMSPSSGRSGHDLFDLFDVDAAAAAIDIDDLSDERSEDRPIADRINSRSTDVVPDCMAMDGNLLTPGVERRHGARDERSTIITQKDNAIVEKARRRPWARDRLERHGAAVGVDALSTVPSRVTPGARKSWRGHPVAQSSL